MSVWQKFGLFAAGLPIILSGPEAFSQSISQLATAKPEAEIYTSIGTRSVQQTQIQIASTQKGLPVKVIHDWPNLTGEFNLTLTLSKRRNGSRETKPQIVSTSTLFLENIGPETDAILTYPSDIDGLQIEASLRDENQNLVLESDYPLPVLSRELRIIKLTPLNLPTPDVPTIPEFTTVETISGKVILPPKSSLSIGSTLHVQLLENALAGGLSLQMVAEETRQANANNGEILFTLERGLWDRSNEPDLAFKAWITDSRGQKSYVMRKPVNYNGPEIEYSLRLDSLKQGKNTKKGQFLNPELMAQTLVQGEAQFKPVNGIPGQARLEIKLRQDRGDFNRNPLLAEQTLILHGMETRIPFSLTTDSTHFDPYAPAPILSVSLTDSFGRVYYDSGEIRAQEGQNFIQLFPR